MVGAQALTHPGKSDVSMTPGRVSLRTRQKANTLPYIRQAQSEMLF